MPITRTFFSRAPLAQSRFAPLPSGAVLAAGPVRDRLIALRAGLLSRAERLLPEHSAWLGGDLPGGIAAANALEATVLTGALLGDEELRQSSLSLCRRVAAAQHPDGSFGAQDETFAARGRMLRAVTSAYAMSGERELLVFMLRYMQHLRMTLAENPLSPEDSMHTADTLEAGLYLYNVTGQKGLLPVLEMVSAQSADYASIFSAFPYRTPLSRTISGETMEEAIATEAEDGYYHHLQRTASAANLCEGLRQSAFAGILSGSGKQLSAPEAGLARMNRLHGAVCGGVTGDPLLAGTNPVRGVSAVSACELAASLEALLSCPDGEFGADQLETVFYNAIGAAFSADGHAVQPVQQGNQVSVSRAARFPMSADGVNLFSLSDGETLGALLAAVPRFYQHQWMLTRDEGLCAMGYAPVSVRYRLSGARVRVEVSSNYPASGAVRIRLRLSESVAFPLVLRIPGWAKGATAAISGEIVSAAPGTMLTLSRQWNDGDEVLLSLPMAARTIPGYHQAVSVARGPLRFAYAPAYDEKKLPDGTSELLAKPGFGAALVGNAPISVVETENGVSLRAKLQRVSSWGMRGACCDQPPIDAASGAEAFEAPLVPYAGAAIRLAVLPVV